MSSPGWVEVTVTDGLWDEIPVNWVLDPVTGLGLNVVYDMGEMVIDTSLFSGADPGWQEPQVTPWSDAAEWTVYQMSWQEIGADA